jgi:hypothetical protein
MTVTQRFGTTPEANQPCVRALSIRLCLLFCLLLSACAQAASPTPTVFPPSATPPATATVNPTMPAWLPSATLPPIPSATSMANTPTPGPADTSTPEVTLTPAVPLTDRAEFSADVTVPDGTPYKIDATFVKTWRVKNVGTATWTTDYALIFAKGEAMTTTQTVPLLASVAPGQTVELSLTLTVPAKTGRHQGFWQLRNAAGALFGIGVNANEPIYVDIFAVTDKAAGGPPVQVNSATLSIAQPSINAPCPYDLIINGTLGINASGSGRVTAQLEATFSDPNFKFTSPGMADFNFLGTESNPFPIAYTLTFVGNVTAQFELHVLTPNDLRSAPVTFSLTCSP